MAKTLAERLIAAKKPHARLNDNEALLADLKAELARLSAARDQAAGESIDFALSDADRDEAATKAGRYERTAKGIETEIAGLAALIEERRDEEAAAAAEKARAEVRAERDALAIEFAETVPQAVATLTDLFARVKANAERLNAIRDYSGCAEAKARGLAGFVDPLGPKQFTKMIIPDFHGRERVWPPVENLAAAFVDVGAAMERARQQREADAERKRKTAEDYARDHGRYELATVLTTYEPVHIPATAREKAPALPHAVGNGWPWVGMLPHALAEELKAVTNLKVTPFDEGKKK